MSILETLKAVKETGFDPQKDKINSGGQALPAGEYPVRLKSVAAEVRPSNNRVEVNYTLEVVSGDFKGRNEWVRLAFDDELPDFVREKNGKTLLKLAAVLDVDLKKGDLASEDKLADAFQVVVGKQLKLDLKVRENKKKPDFPYRDHDFEKLDDSVDEIEDSELPF